MNKNNLKLMLFLIIAILSITIVAAETSEKIPISDGFDYPVGDVNGNGQYLSPNGVTYDGWLVKFDVTDPNYIEHTGEDWNGVGGGDTDLYQPVYAVSNGVVIYADNGGSGWGNVILIQHKLHDGTMVFSQYAHLDTISVIKGDNVRRRQQIGTLGRTGLASERGAHLHFEMRKANMDGYSEIYWPKTNTKDTNWIRDHYYNPSDHDINRYDSPGFIDANRPKITPLIGDWNDNDIDTKGTFNPHTSIFSLDNGVNPQLGEPGDLPIVGDWNGNGIDTIGVYRPTTAQFFLDNNNDGEIKLDVDQKIQFGVIGDYPIVGNWNGDKKDEIGVFRSLDSNTLKTTFFLEYPDRAEAEIIEFGTQKDIPIIGDWNNNGIDDIGVFRRYDVNNNAVFYIRNGAQTINVSFGNNDDIPIVGKWDNNGPTKIGVYRPSAPEPFIFNHDSMVSISIMDKLKQIGEETINTIRNYVGGTSSAPTQDTVDTTSSIEQSAPDVSIIDKLKQIGEETINTIRNYVDGTSNIPAQDTADTPTPISESELINIETNKLSGKIIVIDPGHKSTETVKINTGEYEINHKIGSMLQALLIKDGATVYLTDVMGDTNEPGITERANFAISKDPDLFLSIHTNAATPAVRGVEVWLWEGNDKTEFREREFAELIYKNVIEQTEHPSTRGIREKEHPWNGESPNYHVGIPILSDYKYPSPAVLVELDFTTYSSPVDFKGKTYDNMRQLMKSSEYQNSAALALRNAIYEYYEITIDSEPTTSEPIYSYESIREVFGQDWQPAPIFISRDLVNQGIYGAVNINGGIDVYTIGPSGMKETPESYYQKFGTYDQNGIVGIVTIDQARSLGIDVTSTSTTTPTTSPPQITSITPVKTMAGDFDLTIIGNDFDTSAVDQISWKADGNFVGQGTILSQTSTKIVVKQFMTGAEGVYVVKVKNADGQLSNGVDLTIDTQPNVQYQAHFAYTGWMSNWVLDGGTAGTPDGNQMEAIKIKTSDYGITYRAHVADDGWLPWVSNEGIAGTTDQGKSLQAIEIKLQSAPSNMHVQYRVFVDRAWQNWVSDGQMAGTTGLGLPVEAIEIKISS